MTAAPLIPVVYNPLTILLIVGICANIILAQDGTSFAEIQTETSSLQRAESENELPANRVLPVDAEHKSKITFPQQSLDPICVQTLRENLVKFLKRLKRNGVRQARQDDGDDGDDGDEGGGLLAGLGEGNGALAAFGQLPSFLPQFVTTLTQISGAVNQGLNGTDTPNLPSFLVKQGQQLIQALTATQGSRTPPRPSPVHVDRVPGSGGVPPRRPRPPSPSYQEYPEDYIDEVVKQPLQPTVPLNPRPANYDPYPGNPYLENIQIPVEATQEPTVESINGLPTRTSLWQIYKSFRNKNPVNGSLSDFQLAHPDAFSNELLQSISNSISNVRGQSPNVVVSMGKPTSEIFQQFHPPGQEQQQQQPSIFNNHNRPTLSVYKPASVITGVGVDLNNLALNASMNKIESQSSSHTSGEQPEEEVNPPPSIQHELELDSVSSLGVAQAKPGGSRGTVKPNGRPAYNIKNNVATTGSLAQLHAQQTQGSNNINAQFVKSPTSAHLALAMGEYVPAVSSLHEEEDFQKVGPQTTGQDTFNGFINKSPYTPVKGVLLDAPRLTPSPLYASKPPSNLYIGQTTQTTAAPFPEFSFQAANVRPGSGTSSLFPPGASIRPKDPNAPRAPTVSAAISSNFAQYPQHSQQINGLLPPSLLPQNNNQYPQSEAFSSSIITSTEISQQESQPEEDIVPPGTNKHSFIGSSLSNLAQASQPLVSPENSPNAPGSNNQGNNPPFSSGLVNTVSQNQNSKLLLYLLTNFPQLLGVNPSPSPQPQIPNESPNDATSASESTTTTTTIAPQVQEVILTSTLAPAPPPAETPTPPQVEDLVVTPQAPQAPNFASLLLHPVSEVKPSGPTPPLVNTDQQSGEINSNVFPINLGTNGLAPSGSDSHPEHQQHYLQNSLPFGGLIQGPSNSPTASKNDTEKDAETTTSKPISDILTIGKFVSPSIIPTASVQSNLVEVSGNEVSQTVESTYEATEEPPATIISVSTSISVITNGPETTEVSISQPDNSEFPSLSHLYGNPAPKPNPELEEESFTQIVTSTSTSTTRPYAQLAIIPPLGYQHLLGIPDSVAGSSSNSFAPPLPPPLSPPNSKPVIAGPSFQGPSKVGGYPALVPSTPVLGSSSGLQAPPLGASPPGQVDSSQNNGTNQTSPDGFSQKLASLGTSAIAEMSKLPFFQGDSFRPSVLPPYFIGGNEDSYEQVEPEPEKPISELFPSLANVSNEIVTSTQKGDPSVTPEEDSIEQEIPNFPPGKPAFWMNMYYPNGIPVLTKVRTTTLPTTMSPTRRRRRKSTTPPPPTTPTPVPEAEYYEDEDPTKPKRKKIGVDFD